MDYRYEIWFRDRNVGKQSGEACPPECISKKSLECGTAIDVKIRKRGKLSRKRMESWFWRKFYRPMGQHVQERG